jgi:hypothetical protein
MWNVKRVVAGDEFDAALHEVGQESDVAGQPVQFGDDQGGAPDAAGRDRGEKPRPIGALAGFDLLHFRNDQAVAVRDFLRGVYALAAIDF